MLADHEDHVLLLPRRPWPSRGPQSRSHVPGAAQSPPTISCPSLEHPEPLG